MGKHGDGPFGNERTVPAFLPETKGPSLRFLTFETKGQKRKDRPCVSCLRFLAVIVFMATRQPYAGIACFAFLVIKGFLIAKTK